MDVPGFPADGTATVLLDGRRTVSWWSRAAADLFGRTADEVLGRPVAEALGAPLPPGTARVEGAELHRADGTRFTADLTLLPTAGAQDTAAGAEDPAVGAQNTTVGAEDTADRRSATGSALLVVEPHPTGPGRADDVLLARALLQQDRLAVAHLGPDLELLRTNPAFEVLRLSGLAAPGEGPQWLERLRTPDDASSAREAVALVAARGDGVIGAEYRLTEPLAPAPASGPRPRTATHRVFSLTGFRATDPAGAPAGVVLVLVELPGRDGGRLQLAEAYRRAAEIGASLDVVGGARELVDILVPALGDLAAVDFPDAVLQGRDPQLGYPGPEASAPRRVAAKAAVGRWPTALVQVGELTPTPAATPETAAIAVGGAILFDPATALLAMGDQPELAIRHIPAGLRSAIGCPLYHRGRLFGYVQVWRTGDAEPHDQEDLRVVQDLCDRTALALDNSFRYTREHRTAVVLQRSLLPPAATASTACETAGSYRPASGAVSVGGDWYDAFPLSSLRVALVVGDVVGHGLQATATMARLRTAVQTLAELDLPPDELLIRLNDLVQRMAAEADEPDTVGASCLFAVYDPVTGTCELASAGHPPPLLLTPDGRAEVLAVPPGPLLGAADQPFEPTRTVLPAGSLLALYTDGLTAHDPDTALPRLLTELTRRHDPDRPLADIGAHLIATVPAEHPDDDIALLLARTRTVPPDSTAGWRYTDLSEVSRARADTAARLAAWGLDHLAFAVELIVSELVTNAIRHAGGPAELRLIRDRILVCEVSDPSNTQPRLRRALETDEGGRGLFLIAQLSDRWGCRYAARGKTIWAEFAVEPEL